MTDFTNMTKKELLALPTVQLIKGRHEMTKAQIIERLEAAVNTVTEEVTGEQDIQAQFEETMAVVEEDAVRAMREVGVDMPAPIKKVWVNKSGNIPWRKKHYAIDVTRYEAANEAGLVSKAPNQVQLILRGMIDLEFTSPGRSRIGKDIIDALKQAGKLNTTIPSASLFAYYRKAMEDLGVVHVKNPDLAAFHENNAEQDLDDEEEEGEE